MTTKSVVDLGSVFIQTLSTEIPLSYTSDYNVDEFRFGCKVMMIVI